ncbi:MAG: hypothetical protein ABEK50_05085 [bacterium]
MNKQLVEHWVEQFDLDSNEAELLESFSVLMDRNSLWLMDGQSTDDGIAFIYTDEAVHYKFPLSEMKQIMEELDSGKSLDWEQIEEDHAVSQNS